MVNFNTYFFIKTGQSINDYNFDERWLFLMLDLTWKVFRKTGNIKVYLLFKTLQSEHKEQMDG